MSRLGVPVVTIVIGEGGSGGALGLGVANRVYMLENAYYSVISPESCAAIIYRDSGKAAEAARALRLTAVGSEGAGLDRRHHPRTAPKALTPIPTKPPSSSRKQSAARWRSLRPRSRQGADRRSLQQIPPHGEFLRGGPRRMNKTVVIGIVFVVAGAGVPGLFEHAHRQVSRGSVRGFHGRNRMPDGLGRHAGSRAAKRAIERLRVAGVGGDRHDAVRARRPNQREVAGDEVEDRSL